MSSCIRLVWVGLVLSLCCTGSAFANLSNPWSRGDSLSEPIGVFKQIHILREELSFDLRPLGSGQSREIAISAKYEIEQKGKTAAVPLFFVALGLTKGRVSFDGKPLVGRKLSREIPKQWSGSKKPVKAEGLSFVATITPGKHTIVVEYKAGVGMWTRGGAVREYHTRYALGPAKRWASFGTLDMSVFLPDGWSVVSDSLKLTGKGNMRKGSFRGVPADVFKLAVKPPIGWLLLKIPLLILLFVVGVGVSGLGVWRGRHWLFGGRSVWLRGFGLVGAFAVFQALFHWLAMSLLFFVIERHPHAADPGYDHLGWALLGLFVLPFSFALLSALCLIVYRRRQRRLLQANA